MNTPPLLLGASLLFWGWHSGMLITAFLIALFLEGSRVVPSRLNFPITSLYRVWDLCAVLFLAAAIYLYTSNQPTGVLLGTSVWLPLIFLPIMAAQAYGAEKQMALSVFFLLLRGEEIKKGAGPKDSVNISYPYFALCIAAACASNPRTIWFYAGILLLSAWTLLFLRSKRFSLATWALLFFLVAGMGYGGSIGLRLLHKELEETFIKLYSEFFLDIASPFKASTAIGDIGTVKLSNEIVLRLERGHGATGQLLLPQASYNVYRGSSWYAVKSTFADVYPGEGGDSWSLQKSKNHESVLIFWTWLKLGKGLLTLPENPLNIEHLPVAKMLMNRLGSVRVEQGPGLINYTVKTGKNATLNGPPDGRDISIPEKEKAVITLIAAELGLNSKSPGEVVDALMTFFRKNFKYSLDLRSSGFYSNPLEDFLTKTKVGHCEYFATTTTLLLRSAGIPARYTVGYVGHEYSGMENKILVRGRDAHSWAIAFINGGWKPIDTTPAAWIESDKQYSSGLEPISDLFSYFFFLYSKWRWREKESGLKEYSIFIILPLVLILGWRIYSRAKLAPAKPGEDVIKAQAPKPGLESEFYLVEKRIGEFGLKRSSWETPLSWIKRVEEAGIPNLYAGLLRPILFLHYRGRFDPRGISHEEKIALASNVDAWLNRIGPERIIPERLEKQDGQDENKK